MKPARALIAIAVGILATVVCWLILDFWSRRGGDPPPLPWTAVAGIVALAVVVVSAGLPVRQWVHGRRLLDPLLAARTAVLAKAAAYGGPVLFGWYAAQAIIVLPDVVGARRTRLALAVAAAVASIGISVAGFVVQDWCRVPPPDDENGAEPDETD